MAGVGTWSAGTYAGGGQNVLVFRDSSMFAIKGYNCLVCRSPDMACKSTLWYTYWYVKWYSGMHIIMLISIFPKEFIGGDTDLSNTVFLTYVSLIGISKTFSNVLIFLICWNSSFSIIAWDSLHKTSLRD